MTDAPVDLPQALMAAAAPVPLQSGDYHRTLAENRAAAMLAHQFPRAVDKCREEMRFACAQLSVAEEAFYVLKGERNGKLKIHTGSTIKLARELARCWRNIFYDVVEVSRTDTHSHILTYAIDWESNVRGSVENIVPHLGRKLQAEIYEHNASDASRRLREIIFNILPGWFVAEAEDLCRKTLEGSYGTDLEEAVIERLEGLGISLSRLEDEIGRKHTAWRPVDVASLVIKARTIERGDMKADDVFEPRIADELIRELTKDPKRDASLGANGARHVEPGRPAKPKRPRLPRTVADPPRSDDEKPRTGGGGDPSSLDDARTAENSLPISEGGAGSDRQRITQAIPPASIASLGAGVGRTTAEPPAEPPKATEPPIKRGRGRPPKAKPEAAAPTPDAPKAITPPKKSRIDLNGAPDPNEEPVKFLAYFIAKLPLVTDPGSDALEAVSKKVRAGLKGMWTLQKQWADAVERHVKRLETK